MTHDRRPHLLFLLDLALAGAAVWFFFTVLFPWLLPFFLAAALAGLIEPWVRALVRHTPLPRAWASALCLFLLLGLAGSLLGLLLWRLWYEGALFLRGLPGWLAQLPQLTGRLEDWGYRLFMAAPLPVQSLLTQMGDALRHQGLALPEELYQSITQWTASLVAAAPRAVLFLVTTVLASFFASASWPSLLRAFRALLPPSWLPRIQECRKKLGHSLLGWLRAQGILMAVTFLQLTAGFFLLQVELPLFLAAIISLVDALPIFGTGTVLFPWALVSFLQGESGLALGLLALYGVIWLVRSVLEPKLVGDRVGLSPLASLVAMYLGFSAFGVVGMVVSPLAAITAKELWPIRLAPPAQQKEDGGSP